MYLYENETIHDSKLCEAIRLDKGLQSHFRSNFGVISPDNRCGFLSIDGKDYFIVPKIVRDAAEANLDIFIYMLLFAYDIQLSNEALATFENRKSRLFELFVRLFADKLLEELKRGIYREYVTIRDDLRMLRGKYLFEHNFRHFHHQRLHCEFDEFSMDNELNRFFLYAIRHFKRFSATSNLSRCETILDEVDAVTVDPVRFRFSFDRLSERFRPSYELARMLLEKLIPMPRSANERSFAFLFDMAELFEKFVARLVKEIAPSARIQMPRNFRNLQLKPDILIPNLIIDTKYKKVGSREDFLAADKYQLFTYGINFGIRDTMLLYPRHLVDLDENLILGIGENAVGLRMRSLDLRFEGGYEEFIDYIKMETRGLIYEL